MKILLLGATGRTGKLVLEKALAGDHQVNILVRNSNRIKQQPGLIIFEGDPANQADLQKALSGCHYVISALNISRKSDFPWSPLRTPPTYLSDVMQGLLSITDNQLKRIIICSAWGVSETREDIPKWFKWFIDNSNIKFAYHDHERQEKMLERSQFEWTIVRPVGLTNAKAEQSVKESFDNQPRPSLTISRKAVANYLVKSLKDDGLSRKKVVISKE